MEKMRMIGQMVFTVSLLCLSCGDNFLDKVPQGVESDENFFKTKEHAIRATTAIYDALAWYDSQEIFEWFLGDICSDDAEKGGEGAADWADLQALKEFRGSPDNSILPTRYSEPYQGIYRANLVIENVSEYKKEVMDTTLRNQLVGEAKFLRGYFYFQLVKTFGGVPLVTKVLNPSEYYMPRATMEECWAQIEKDFKDAAAVLPGRKATDIGRATQGAAKSFLVKAYMYQGKSILAKFDSAYTVASEVIASGDYDLDASYEHIFTLDGENGDESIFEIQHKEIQTDDWGDDNEGQVTSIYQGGRLNGWFPGWGFNCPTQDFVDEFEDNDPRLEATVVFDGETLYKGITGVFFKADNSMSPTGMHAQKYLLEHQENAPEMSNSPANWRVYRFAELLLFHAEAACETGRLTEAQTSLNRVRARVKMPPVTASDQTTLREAIYHERRVELGLEGHRFFDLVRQGRAAQVLGKNGFIQGRHEYFPIPQIEIDVNDKIVQNPY